jgi:hypothetical protein
MQSRPQKTDQRLPCYVQFATAIRGWTAGRSRYVHDSFRISRPPELQLQPGNDAIHQEFNGAALNTRYVIPPGTDLARPQLQRNETHGQSSVYRVFLLLHWPRQQEDPRLGVMPTGRSHLTPWVLQLVTSFRVFELHRVIVAYIRGWWL